MHKILFGDREVIWAPNPGPQTAFLGSAAREVFYGGAAAGGKSDAIIAGAGRFADHPLHRAIIFRRTRPQLQEVIDRARNIYPEIIPGAEWIERESRFYLPAGGFIQMGYAEHEDDILKFKTFEYNYIGFDELTSFTERQYTFMFSRNRSKTLDLPLQVRSASNPGDIGHEWVFKRFLRNRKPFEIYVEHDKQTVGDKTYDVSFTRQFIPAKLSDNPKLPNPEEYIAGILQMGEEGEMYLHGAWVRLTGTMFKRMPVEVVPKLKSSNYYVIMCMDYGLNDPSAVYWLVVYDDNTVDIAGELYANELNLDDLAQLIKDKEKELGLRKPILRVGDPKMFARESDLQSIATGLGKRGLDLVKANNDRVAGWAQVQRFIFGKLLRVWAGAAPDLLRTMPNLMRHPTKPDDIKDKQEDHPADSLRYGLMAIHENLAGNSGSDNSSTSSNNPDQDTEFDKIAADAARSYRDGEGEYYEGLGQWT
jgi:hypothetical protein